MRWTATARRGLLGLLLAMLLPMAVAMAQDYPTNGSFAQGGTPPAGWNMEAEAANKGSLALRPAPAGTPGQVLELSPNARNTPSDKPFGVGQLLPAAALRGKELAVSAMLGGQGGARAVLGLVVLTRNGAGASVQLRGDGALARQEDRLSVPDDAGLVGVVLYLVAEGTSGTARFAAVSISPAGGAATPPGNSNRRSGAASPDQSVADIVATVRIDTAQVRRIIPRALFGTNIEVIRNANGLWDNRNNRLDPQIVALARDLSLGPIRFPGGVWSDAYDWRNGVGPMDRRAVTPTHPGADETYRNNFGTDEALRLAADAGTTLLITVNAATGTPQLAADWVRYVNGEGGRAPRGPHVDLWQIGNELYMEGDASGGHMSPQAYADRLLAFSAAMRAVDPTIRIAAIGLRNAGRYRLNAYDNWDEVVLRRAASAIDVLTVHNGYAPVVGDNGGLDAADVYAAMWAAPLLVARNLTETWQEVARFAPADAGRIQLGVTEWGPLFAASVKSPWVDHVKTLGSAVFVASMLKVFAEEPHLALANFFKLNEASFMGWIGRRGTAWVPTAPYLAFRMVARDMEKGLLAAKVTVPGYASRAVGFIDRVANVPYLDVLATASADGRTVTTLLINKSITAAVAGQVTLDGAAGAARLVTQTLTGDAVDSNTGTELPRLPGLRWAAQRAVGPEGRIDRGGPGEVRLTSAEQADPGAQTQVHVPPHSVVLLRFEGVRK